MMGMKRFKADWPMKEAVMQPEDQRHSESAGGDIFEMMDRYGHEQVIFCRHRGSGLKAIIAIHDTTMGPALGGCRMAPYGSTEEALEDVLRLSWGMTYKCGAADVDFGGGKAVIIGDPKRDKSPELFRAFGRFVGGLNGRFYTGTDMGTSPEDFVHARRESRCFVGLPESHGGSGDTSMPTALGVLQGMKATALELWGSEDLSGRTVAVQGVGKVGARLVRLLVEEGARCLIADVDGRRVDALREAFPDAVEPVEVGAVHAVSCDIFAPCAGGGIINDETIEELKCRAVVGSANSQVEDDGHGHSLHERGSLYAPDREGKPGGLREVAAA